MKFMIQPLRYGSCIWISHFEDTLQKLGVIHKISNQKIPSGGHLMKEVG